LELQKVPALQQVLEHPALFEYQFERLIDIDYFLQFHGKIVFIAPPPDVHSNARSDRYGRDQQVLEDEILGGADLRVKP